MEIENMLTKESWIAKNWRPAAAVIYLVICLFDFILAPTWMFLTRETTDQLVRTLVDSHLDPSVQAILVTPRPAWTPLTLQGAGMFHIAFGGILGVSAWSRGSEKKELIRSRINMATEQLATKVTAIVPAAAGVVNTVKAKVETATEEFAKPDPSEEALDLPKNNTPDDPDA